MSWQEFKEMVYYTLLKRGQVLIAILGLVVAILVYMNAQHYGVSVNTVSANVIATCQYDTDCLPECGKCVAVASNRICDSALNFTCACVNKSCIKLT